jgi:SAM-dependent methyltransferase
VTAAFLTSPSGLALLREIEGLQPPLREANFLTHLAALRKKYPQRAPAEVGAALELHLLRQKAQASGKFSQATHLFFTKSGLEQASGEVITAYRVQRFVQNLALGARIADLGCGIGGDSLALAQQGFQVIGIDLDAERLELARANAQVYNVQDSIEFSQLDINDFNPKGYTALFFDPARRTEAGKRLFSVEAYQPPLSIIQKWLPVVPNLAVKISPGVDYSELQAYNCEVEIISENGDVKEAVLWFGALQSHDSYSQPVLRRATLLPQRHTLISQVAVEPLAIGTPLNFLYEPDGAVIRAGLVQDLGRLMGGSTSKIDEDIAFLTSMEPLETPFARRFTIREAMPFNLKKLNRRLQELEVGHVIVKKRGSPLDPQQLEHALKLKGTLHLTLVLTHVLGQAYVLLCD